LRTWVCKTIERKKEKRRKSVMPGDVATMRAHNMHRFLFKSLTRLMYRLGFLMLYR
jgi:hypothetical protein